MKDWAGLPLRIALGTIFIFHGAQKAFGAFSGGGIEGFSQFLSSLGFAPAHLWAYAGAYIELLGGILLIIGCLSRIVSAVLLVEMIIAAVTVHISKGFLVSGGGYEYIMLIIFSLLSLIFAGGGKLVLTKKL